MDKRIHISIIIPAYNEAKRLPLFLDRIIAYCTSKSEQTYEVIVVDDGSTDRTLEIATAYKARFPHLHTVSIRKNRGKGYAVKRGLLKASGDICLFLDADGSVGPEEIARNLHYILEDGYDIFIGSRVLRDNAQILKVKWYRKTLGLVFNFLMQTFLLKDIKDTQCGFKMFKKEVVAPLFARGYIQGFGFDIEILYLAHKMGYKVKEGPVSWRHIGGSKINLFTDSITMFLNMLQIKNWHCSPINVFNKYMGPNEYTYSYDLENYHWWFVSRRSLAIRLIKSLPAFSPKILDVGSGTGGNLLLFNKLGESFGIDISEKAVEFCRKRGLKNVSQSSVEEIKYDNNFFDIITCLDVLEHVVSPADALLEMKRVLKDTGSIIIMVPAFRVLWSEHDEALCHLRRYEKSLLLSDMYEAGLKADKVGYFFFTSFFAVAPIRIMRRFFGFQRKRYSDTTTLPPKLLNEFLKFLFRIEMRLADRIGLPFGTTIYAVASKKKGIKNALNFSHL